jgi:hypothetical protein
MGILTFEACRGQTTAAYREPNEARASTPQSNEGCVPHGDYLLAGILKHLGWWF